MSITSWKRTLDSSSCSKRRPNMKDNAKSSNSGKKDWDSAMLNFWLRCFKARRRSCKWGSRSRASTLKSETPRNKRKRSSERRTSWMSRRWICAPKRQRRADWLASLKSNCATWRTSAARGRKSSKSKRTNWQTARPPFLTRTNRRVLLKRIIANLGLIVTQRQASMAIARKRLKLCSSTWKSCRTTR